MRVELLFLFVFGLGIASSSDKPAFAAGLDCLSGPQRSDDRAYQNWTITSTCGFDVKWSYTLIDGYGRSEPRTAYVSACKRWTAQNFLNTQYIWGAAYGVDTGRVCGADGFAHNPEKNPTGPNLSGADGSSARDTAPMPSLSDQLKSRLTKATQDAGGAEQNRAAEETQERVDYAAKLKEAQERNAVADAERAAEFERYQTALHEQEANKAAIQAQIDAEHQAEVSRQNSNDGSSGTGHDMSQCSYIGWNVTDGRPEYSCPW